MRSLLANRDLTHRSRRSASRIGVAVLLALSGGLANAQKGPAASPLTGVRSVEVIIEKLDDDAIAAGVSAERLRTVVELKLRLAGLGVVSETEAAAARLTIPYVYVRVSLLKLNTDAQFFFFDFDVDFWVSAAANQNGA